MASIFSLLKNRKTDDLPFYGKIALDDVKPASAILFYGGGPRITQEAAVRMYKHPHRPAAFHAALYLGNGDFLNVGAFKTVESIRDEFRSTRRLDVIEYDMSNAVRDVVLREGYRDADRPSLGISLPTYGITDFLRFGFKWWKPSPKDICSENVTEILRANGVECAYPSEPCNVAPWMLQEWAEANYEKCTMRTLFVGGEYSNS